MEAYFHRDIPKVIYKYRSSLRIESEIFGNSIYFPSAHTLNDPFEGNIPIRLKEEEITEDMIFKKYYQMTQAKYPNLSDSEIHAICFENQRRGLFKDPKHLEEVNNYTRSRLKTQFGIFSTTKNKNSYLMWSYYADSHKGFNIGYDSRLLFDSLQCQIGEVIYDDEIPYYELFEEHSIFNFIKPLNTKNKNWEHENEIRVISATHVNQVVKLPIKCIKEIRLGVAMNQKEKMNIIEFVQGSLTHIRLFDMKFSNEKLIVEEFQIF